MLPVSIADAENVITVSCSVAAAPGGRSSVSTKARRELERCRSRIYASFAFHTYALVFRRAATDHNTAGRSAGSSTRRVALSNAPVPVLLPG
jgi:hypothetical protein